jgi:uncharacterized protein
LKQQLLGPGIFNDQVPQIVVEKDEWQRVEKDEWQRAESLGDWTLIGVIVAPAFSFEGFEMALPGWEPNEKS